MKPTASRSAPIDVPSPDQASTLSDSSAGTLKET
ncbi:hypothetical protein COLO4_09041 [Corchorus olitorius]|uniref:Uncharacterized protein n=1 Tax=Corchorus olitorius TaxID=93759 RepID=A0A1R3KDE7_9ROSI|nr:hypothetical protein COLO4_09041 [Corchorus olitorius]